MAVIDLSNWTPETYAGEMIKRYTTTSAVEQASGRREPMISDTKKIAKDADADVTITPTGLAYTEDTKAGTNIQLDAAKLTHLSSYNEEDLSDALAWQNATDSKKRNASSNLGLLFDNASLAVTGARVDESVGQPYESVYHNIATNAAGNIITVSKAAFATDSKALNTALSTVLDLAENSAWASEDLVWVASPAFKSLLRTMDATGKNGVNWYVPALGGPPGTMDRDAIGDYPAYWSRAARLSAAATYAPAASVGAKGALGNAIAVLVPRTMLVIGDRAPLESMYLDPKTGIGALSDKAYLKMRRRAAFVLGEAAAGAVLEIIT